MSESKKGFWRSLLGTLESHPLVFGAACTAIGSAATVFLTPFVKEWFASRDAAEIIQVAGHHRNELVRYGCMFRGFAASDLAADLNVPSNIVRARAVTTDAMGFASAVADTLAGQIGESPDNARRSLARVTGSSAALNAAVLEIESVSRDGAPGSAEQLKSADRNARTAVILAGPVDAASIPCPDGTEIAAVDPDADLDAPIKDLAQILDAKYGAELLTAASTMAQLACDMQLANYQPDPVRSKQIVVFKAAWDDAKIRTDELVKAVGSVETANQTPFWKRLGDLKAGGGEMEKIVGAEWYDPSPGHRISIEGTTWSVISYAKAAGANIPSGCR